MAYDHDPNRMIDPDRPGQPRFQYQAGRRFRLGANDPRGRGCGFAHHAVAAVPERDRPARHRECAADREAYCADDAAGQQTSANDAAGAHASAVAPSIRFASRKPRNTLRGFFFVGELRTSAGRDEAVVCPFVPWPNSAPPSATQILGLSESCGRLCLATNCCATCLRCGTITDGDNACSGLRSFQGLSPLAASPRLPNLRIWTGPLYVNAPKSSSSARRRPLFESGSSSTTTTRPLPNAITHLAFTPQARTITSPDLTPTLTAMRTVPIGEGAPSLTGRGGIASAPGVTDKLSLPPRPLGPAAGARFATPNRQMVGWPIIADVRSAGDIFCAVTRNSRINFVQVGLLSLLSNSVIRS